MGKQNLDFYGYDKLNKAVLYLAKDTSKTKHEQVSYVIETFLIKIKPEKSLPAEIIEDFKSFMRKYANKDIPEKDLDEIIDNIVMFYNITCRYLKFW